MSSTTTRSRRHLLLVTHHYAPEHGAPQRRWGSLTPRLIEAGVDVSVLTPPPHYPSGRLFADLPEYRPGRVSRGVHGERIVRTRFREHTNRLRSRSVDQAVAAWSTVVLGLRLFRHPARRPDIVVGTVPGIPSMFAAWIVARLLRARFVVEMRDAWPDLIEPAGLFRARRSLKARVLGAARAVVHRTVSRLQSRADAVVTTTETFADVLRSRGVRRVAVVRNGTSFESVRTGSAEPTASPESPESTHPLHHRPLRAAYAGTIGRAQDLETVVRAAARLRDRGRAVEVRIVGTGAELGTVRRLVDQLDAPVVLGDPVPHEQIRDLYAWADTVLVSLRDWEPLEWTVPSKLYEVMASGRLATACVAGEAADLVATTGAGAVVMPGDVDGLVDLWGTWVDDGAAPTASAAAARWVRANADDDVLGAHYVQLVDHLTDAAAHHATADRRGPCQACTAPAAPSAGPEVLVTRSVSPRATLPSPSRPAPEGELRPRTAR
ncbi:glycosyltransferase family 4 protein [Isoptericola sediminis]|uniref:D-inositol 3-phosphate glycosyltransferase n=1 Tax=Isoptericola sediminis TaxID=2733572 RepID=A0A849KG91_9MICO|nr:glycosyltransferase family 4 protein [Isoptericola sediminis]NNU27573.1 glycosyltransferase family 4 protein [Isoptericola sediminis]